MKTKLLYLIILISTFVTNAQNKSHDYVPMAVENAQWVYYNSDDDMFPPWIDYYFGYKIQGDIEIDGIWYKKVYYRAYTPISNENAPATPPVYISTEVLFGAIRDDIANKRVYGIVFSGNSGFGGCGIYDEEFLMYDFNLNIGDTMEDFCLVGGGNEISVEGITEEYLFNENRLVIHLIDEFGYLLEGIGNYFPYDGYGYFGLFNPMGVPAGCPCTDFVLYCIGKDEDCLNGFAVIGTNEYHLQNDISIYPNPARTVLFLDNKNNIQINFVKVYDIRGKLLIDKQTNFQQINIQELESGFLWVQIETDKACLNKKIIKK